MSKRKSWLIAAGATVLSLCVMAAIGLGLWKGFCYWWKKEVQGPPDPYYVRYSISVDQKDRDNQTERLRYLTEETLTGQETPEEKERIQNKTALLTKQREKIQGLQGPWILINYGGGCGYEWEQYELLENYKELLELEPEPTPVQALERQMRLELFSWEDKLEIFSHSIKPDIGIWDEDQFSVPIFDEEAYRAEEARELRLDVEKARAYVEQLRTLQQQLWKGQLTLEQGQAEYARCRELARAASPVLYVKQQALRASTLAPEERLPVDIEVTILDVENDLYFSPDEPSVKEAPQFVSELRELLRQYETQEIAYSTTKETYTRLLEKYLASSDNRIYRARATAYEEFYNPFSIQR